MKRFLSVLLTLCLLAASCAALAEGEVEIKLNLAYGNKSRTMTYNQPNPMTLSDGDVVTAGMLKPMWSYVARMTGTKLVDVAIQDAKATEMIQTESTTGFAGANIFGGNSVAGELINYGVKGLFVNLSDLMKDGQMPYFKGYLDENPSVRSAITAYDGNIYYVPYIAEIGEIARTMVIRESWVTKLLDAADAAYDSAAFTTYYGGYYVGDNARVGDNGGVVTPKADVKVEKKTAQSIIEIQNALAVKNGETLTKAFIAYINDNYGYEKPSELFLGAKAAYDIDEMIALFRCIKANPGYLTDGKADTVWPFFTRQSSYREDLLRFATYWGGVRVHGTDTYESRWMIDTDGNLQYTYAQEALYDILGYLSDIDAEGLIFRDIYDITSKTNYRTRLWGTDNSETPSFGFMTYDWIASSTTDALNKDTCVILPPVAKVNGVWQYYIDNSRVIKPDGWAISVAGSNEETIRQSAKLMDFFFSPEGAQAQTYGLPMDIEENEKFVGPTGIEYPKFKPWVQATANAVAKGDLSTFLRDWIGSLMPVGFQKDIGFEYQYTSERGFEGWKLLQESTLNIPTYAGTGIEGENPNYYMLVPTVFSLTPRQQEAIADNCSLATADIVEYMFNVVRYKTLGNAPAGTEVAETYDEYIKYFNDRGLETYVKNYQAAYMIMLMK